jgi:CO/xanthine dehydrogenase Mo-binding subunit
MNGQTVRVVSRRGFLEGVFSAGAFVLGTRILPTNLQAADTVDEAAWHPSVYLGLEPDGRVIIIAHRSEMGTGIRTALPRVVADELDADASRSNRPSATRNIRIRTPTARIPSAASGSRCVKPARPRA